MAFAQATRLATEETCRKRIIDILKQYSFAADYAYEEDAGWVAHWVDKRKAASEVLANEVARKRGTQWLFLDAEDTMKERKRVRLARTPIKKSYDVPTLKEFDEDTESISSIESLDAESPTHSATTLLQATLAVTDKIPPSVSMPELSYE
ncbi:hypothetical protein HDU86_008158 [Geranomyces michiganensis]|nr:hypothetical protein HDU86_008158 [Geranomyces michiganensis]